TRLRSKRSSFVSLRSSSASIALLRTPLSRALAATGEEAPRGVARDGREAGRYRGREAARVVRVEHEVALDARGGRVEVVAAGGRAQNPARAPQPQQRHGTVARDGHGSAARGDRGGEGVQVVADAL